MVGVPAAERGEETRNVLFGGLVEATDPLCRQLGEVAGQVAPVRREGVAGEPTFDGEVVEVGLDDALQVP
jgi:hypothetical protein